MLSMVKRIPAVLVAMSMFGASLVQADAKVQSVKDVQVAATADLRIGFVDSIGLMRECEEGIEAAKDLEAKRISMAQELQKEEQSLMQDANSYKTKAAAMSDSAREKEEKELMRKKRDYEIKAQEFEEDFKQEMQRVTTRLGEKIDQIITKVATNLGLDKVFCKSTGRSWEITPKGSITESVKVELNKEYTLAKNTKAPKAATTLAGAKKDEKKAIA